MTCDATFTRGGLTLRCDRHQEHSTPLVMEDFVGMDMDTDHYDFHLDARWSASWIWDVSIESFVPSLCCYFRLPGTHPEEKK